VCVCACVHVCTSYMQCSSCSAVLSRLKSAHDDEGRSSTKLSFAVHIGTYDKGGFEQRWQGDFATHPDLKHRTTHVCALHSYKLLECKGQHPQTHMYAQAEQPELLHGLSQGLRSLLRSKVEQPSQKNYLHGLNVKQRWTWLHCRDNPVSRSIQKHVVALFQTRQQPTPVALIGLANLLCTSATKLHS